MTKQEFEERMGLKVSDETYATFDAMYLEAGNIDKDNFCADLKKHKDSILLHEFYGQAENLKNKLDNARDNIKKAAHMLIVKGHKLGEQDMINAAISLVGEKEYVKMCIKSGVCMSDDDYELILNLIK